MYSEGIKNNGTHFTYIEDNLELSSTIHSSLGILIGTMDVLLFYESTISYWKMLAVQSMSSLMGVGFNQILLRHTVTFFP